MTIEISIRAAMQRVRGSDEHPLRWAFERGSALGFDGLELCMRADRNAFVTFLSDDVRGGIKELCDEYDMTVPSLSSDWAWAYALFHPTYTEWAKGVEYLAEDARLAHEIGAHTILVHFATSQGSWEDCKALLRDVAAAGEQYGVTFGYEANIWASTTGFGGLNSLLRMVDEVGSPHFGVYLHNAYPRGGLPLYEEIEKAGEHLVQSMHSSSLVDGEVKIDWPKAFAAMKEHFDGGAYTFEVPWDEAEENKRAIDEAIARYW
jgi:sugar phosphate isomerase/epimerase